MKLINREQVLSHPFANGKYDHKNANRDFIRGFESYKEWLENLPTIELVRCGECIHHDDGLCHRPKWSFAVEPTDFCSYGEGEPMEIYSGHEGKDRICCNCRHNRRIPKKTHTVCKCDIDGHYIGYVQCFDNWCRHWAKEESR